MTHATYRELLALRLYDELDEDESRDLDAHLSDCAECRAYASELESGLGVLAKQGPVVNDLPDGWMDRLRTEVQQIPAPLHRPWIIAAASFAAGVLLTLVLNAPEVPANETPTRAPSASFERAEPPAPAPTRGRFTQLGE